VNISCAIDEREFSYRRGIEEGGVVNDCCRGEGKGDEGGDCDRVSRPQKGKSSKTNNLVLFCSCK